MNSYKYRPTLKSAGKLRLMVLLSIILFFTGCGGQDTDDAGCVILVTVDALRADQLEIYGGPVAVPGFDAVAQKGVLYTDLATTVPMSRPAVSTVLTGMSPQQTGVRNNTSDSLGSEIPTLASMAREQGWRTAAFAGSSLVGRPSGFQNGFELFDGPDNIGFGPAAYCPPVRESEEVVRHFRAWLLNLGEEEKAFAWVHLSDLQGAATDCKEEEALERYHEHLVALDNAIAEILAIAEERSRVAPVDLSVVGTYGVLLGKGSGTGEARGSAYWLRDLTLRVPGMRCRLPSKGETGAVKDAERRWVPDFHATLASLLGVENGIAGGLGLPLRGFGDQVEKRCRYAWTWAPDDDLQWPNLTAVEHGTGWVVFDSDEMTELAGENSQDTDVAFALRAPATPRNYRLEEEVRSGLVAAGVRLGTGGAPGAPKDQEERDRLLTDLIHLRHHFAADRQRPILRTTRRMLENHPDNLAALMNRSIVLISSGYSKDAEPMIEKMLELYPDRPETLHWAAHLAMAKDDYPLAELLVEATKSLGWEDADLLYDQACLKAKKGEVQEALIALEKAIEFGYRHWDWIERDPDLASIRSDPGYARLLGERSR